MNLLFLMIFSSQVLAFECASDLSSFRKIMGDESFPLLWRETTADDGKPLIVKISEEKGKLFLQFVKTKEGPWAEGTSDICRDQEIVASISKDQIRLGKAAPWILRMSMKSGAKFKLRKIKKYLLEISTFGWSGEFVPEKTL